MYRGMLAHLMLKNDLKWITDVENRQIRAANLSGECNFNREILRGQFKIQKQYPVCSDHILTF
jgi:hypothetical protein